MNDVVLASTEADSAALGAVVNHHATMAGALTVRTQAVVDAASRGDVGAAELARAELSTWCEHDLVPHALAEEKTLYPAARESEPARLLIDAMLDEHRTITETVTALSRPVAQPGDAVRAAASATALRALFESHLWKENELVLPVLAERSDVSLTDLVSDIHELLGAGGHDHAHDHEHGHAHAPGHAHGESGCTCGEHDEEGFPELDARSVPHAIRHATIFGALDAVRPGGGLILVAPHDPLPLLAQIEQRAPGVFSVEYLERGPEAWRLQLVHSGAR
jgi:uncharacterized protein (DUF2249 family)/iron-sulfur cluster repair protein YtfE (RIC family)